MSSPMPHGESKCADLMREKKKKKEEKKKKNKKQQ